MSGLIIKSRSWEKIDAQKVVETCSPEHVVNLIDDAIAEIQRLQADILKWKQLLSELEAQLAASQAELEVAQQRIKDLLQERREAKAAAHRDYYR
jgi:phage shock protein A